jgi:hypothetical protein
MYERQGFHETLSLKIIARSFLEQAKVFPQKPDISQKHVQGRGLILEVNFVGGDWLGEQTSRKVKVTRHTP